VGVGYRRGWNLFCSIYKSTEISEKSAIIFIKCKSYLKLKSIWQVILSKDFFVKFSFCISDRGLPGVGASIHALSPSWLPFPFPNTRQNCPIHITYHCICFVTKHNVNQLLFENSLFVLFLVNKPKSTKQKSFAMYQKLPITIFRFRSQNTLLLPFYLKQCYLLARICRFFIFYSLRLKIIR